MEVGRVADRRVDGRASVGFGVPNCCVNEGDAHFGWETRVGKKKKLTSYMGLAGYIDSFRITCLGSCGENGME